MAAFIIHFFFLVAQPSENAPPPPNYPPPPGQQTPIDDNIWILIALGILLGIYILYKRYSTINKGA